MRRKEIEIMDKIDGYEVRGFDEGNMEVERREIDGEEGDFKIIEGGIDIVKNIGEVEEIEKEGIGLRVKVIGKLKLRREIRKGEICIGGG